MLSREPSGGRHPRALSRSIARRMRGTSPTQPRSPPVNRYSTSSRPIASATRSAMATTSTQSSEPMLTVLTVSIAWSQTCRNASTQAWTSR